ncbi:prostate stem cell antigen-like [Passer domesticus]|uniref:prostate stem cell antigen-like n=1 Tax=Passer domesticus TaxID=48849 RepID=UPI0030FE7247
MPWQHVLMAQIWCQLLPVTPPGPWAGDPQTVRALGALGWYIAVTLTPPPPHLHPGKALKCHKCVASNENDCNQQGSHSCPQYADACSTITAPNSVIKSCSYKSFCDQARRGGSGGATVRCCFSDDCNGPARGSRSGAGATPPPPAGLLATALAGTLLLGRL